MDVSGVLKYLTETYHPHTIIVYGSFVNGTYSPESDFDVVLISDEARKSNDTNVVDGIQLDAFIYNTRDITESYSPTELIQTYDGNILLDEKGYGKFIVENVQRYLRDTARKSEGEKLYLRASVRKMLRHAEHDDAEGLYHLHGILASSLETYFGLHDLPYYGPKKALQWLEEQRPADYALYYAALQNFTIESTKRWLEAVIAIR